MGLIHPSILSFGIFFIGSNDVTNNTVSNDISGVKMNKLQAFNLPQEVLQTRQTAPAIRNIYLSCITGDDDLSAKPDSGEKHFHLLGSRVLRFVQNNKTVVQSATTHECQRRYFQGLTLVQFL